MVFDKAYNDYHLFGNWTSRNVFFCYQQKGQRRLSGNRYFPVTKGKKGINESLWGKTITVTYNQDKEDKVLLLKQVQYQDEIIHRFVFITNNLTLKQKRLPWFIGKDVLSNCFSKKMKQDFQLGYFYKENENAVRAQIWRALSVQLLLTVIQKIAKTKKAFSIVAPFKRIHLISMLNVIEFLSQVKRTYAKQKSRVAGLPSLFAT